jgi:hypothetical protein
MATSPHLSAKLRDALGAEAGEELVQIVDKAANDISGLRGDIAELRHEMDFRFTRMEAFVKQEVSGLKGEIAALRGEMKADMAGLRAEIAAMHSSFLKWWIGISVAGIGVLVALVKVLQG